MNDKDRSFVLRLVLITLCAAAASVILVLEIGLFTERVDNKQVFEILRPLAEQISGALISVISGLIAVKAMGKKDGDG